MEEGGRHAAGVEVFASADLTYRGAASFRVFTRAGKSRRIARRMRGRVLIEELRHVDDQVAHDR